MLAISLHDGYVVAIECHGTALDDPPVLDNGKQGKRDRAGATGDSATGRAAASDAAASSAAAGTRCTATNHRSAVCAKDSPRRTGNVVIASANFGGAVLKWIRRAEATRWGLCADNAESGVGWRNGNRAPQADTCRNVWTPQVATDITSAANAPSGATLDEGKSSARVDDLPVDGWIVDRWNSGVVAGSADECLWWLGVGQRY